MLWWEDYPLSSCLWDYCYWERIVLFIIVCVLLLQVVFLRCDQILEVEFLFYFVLSMKNAFIIEKSFFLFISGNDFCIPAIVYLLPVLAALMILVLLACDLLLPLVRAPFYSHVFGKPSYLASNINMSGSLRNGRRKNAHTWAFYLFFNSRFCLYSLELNAFNVCLLLLSDSYRVTNTSLASPPSDFLQKKYFIIILFVVIAHLIIGSIYIRCCSI